MSAGSANQAPAQPDWLRLDNAAKIYPVTFSDPAPAGFRIGVTLKAPIRVSLLDSALRTVLRRCPYYQVHLRRGFFWYYLQRHDEVPPLYPMREPSVSAIPALLRDTDLFRVQARGSTIAIDFSHILTDGVGGMIFLGTLLTRYLELCGVTVSDWAPFLDPSGTPSPEEYEDAHNRFFDPRAPRPARLSRAYQLPGQQAGPLPHHHRAHARGRCPAARARPGGEPHGVPRGAVHVQPDPGPGARPACRRAARSGRGPARDPRGHAAVLPHADRPQLRPLRVSRDRREHRRLHSRGGHPEGPPQPEGAGRSPGAGAADRPQREGRTPPAGPGSAPPREGPASLHRLQPPGRKHLFGSALESRHGSPCRRLSSRTSSASIS